VGKRGAPQAARLLGFTTKPNGNCVIGLRVPRRTITLKRSGGRAEIDRRAPRHYISKVNGAGPTVCLAAVGFRGLWYLDPYRSPIDRPVGGHKICARTDKPSVTPRFLVSLVSHPPGVVRKLKMPITLTFAGLLFRARKKEPPNAIRGRLRKSV